jgi:hypothetical protein
MNACDPDADIENLRKLIKLNTGVDIKLTKKEICEAYQDIQDGKLPLPPMVMNSTRTYLVDKKSPLKPNDYEQLFDATTKRADLKRIARKVDLKNVDQMTKSQIVDAIGKRLRYMKVHEPVKFARRRRVVPVNRNVNTAVNNTAVNNVSNTNVNRVNNTAVNNTAVNTNVNRANTTNNYKANTTTNNYKMNTTNNYMANTTNNYKANTTNNYKVNTTNTNRPKNKNSKVSFPTGGLFAKGEKPKFLGGAVKNGEKKKGFFASLFGKKENKNFIPANKFKNSKPGYSFYKGNEGLGYYKNTGGLQGPQLPPTNDTKPVPTNDDFALELAVARVKQLGLKREQKFLNQIQLGKAKRKDIVAQAEAAKQEENQFASFLDGLDISNTNKNAFKRRMATDDFKQIQVEAQIKADEKANVARSNEEKMNMFLKTTSLNNTNKTLFLNKARANGSNINALIDEARQLNTRKKTEKLSKKQDEFRTILQNYNKLNATDKEALIKTVAETANVNTMRKMADDLVKKRMEEKKNATAQNLLSFLTPLQINQSNKNAFLRRFRNENADINSIKTEALKLQESKGSANIEALRVKLETRLGELGLNQISQNSIMRKFRNGNRNVNKLIQEAKNLKAQKGATNLQEAKQEYRAFINELPGLTNADKAELTKNNVMNRNRAKQMSNKRLEQVKINDKKGFINFMTELGITNQYRVELLGNFNANRMTMNALKNKATKIAQKIKNDKNAELKTQLNARLGQLGLNQVNKNSIMRKFTNGNRNVNSLIQEAKNLKSTRNMESMTAKRREYAAYLNTLPGLTNADKQGLLNNMNRNKAKTLSNQRVADQKKREREQFEKFLVNLGLDNGDRKTVLNKYNSNTLTVNALQKVAQELKNVRVQKQKAANKKTLMNYLETVNVPKNTKINIERRFNTNQGNLRTLQLEVNKMVKEARNTKIANNRTKLASNVKGSILSNTNKNAFIRRLNAENVNITALRSELNALVTKMIETQREKDRDELEEYMKTQGLTPENQKMVLNKFNVSNKIALTNLKQEAIAILVSRIQQKRNANTGVLTNHGRKLGLTNQEIKNLTNKLNREKLEPLMNEANAIAKKKVQNQKNALNRAKSDYINKLGLNANNKRNILSQNLNLNATKALANQRLQNKIAEKRAKNVTKLGLHLNKLNLNNGEKRKFFNNFNRNVNLNTIMKNASNFESQKKAGIKAEQLTDLKKFLNEQGLNAGEQRPFLNKLNKNQDDLAALKVEAKRAADQKFAKLKAQKRDQLMNVLKGLTNLTQNDINGILRNFDNTNVNAGVLSNRAKEINKTRKDVKYTKNKEEFYGYLNTLKNLTPENRTEITAKLNGYFTNWNAIKQLATNTAVGRVRQRREAEKANLNSHMTKLGLNNNSKRIFFKNLDDGKNVKVVKKDATAYKADLNAKRKFVARKGFSNLLNTLYLNTSDRDALLEQFNDDTTGLNQLQNNAREREAKTINRNRGALTLYLADELKLDAPDVNLLLKNYNADPRSLNTLRNRGRQLKNARNEEERKEIRRQVKEYLNGLNLLNNKNKQNIINKNLPYKNAKAEGNKAQESKRLAKRGAERNTLTNAIKNLPNADKKDLLNKFNTRNVTLNSMLNEAKDLKAKRIAEKRARERTELYNALNGLNMNVADRNVIMNKFNKSNATVNTLRNEAVKLRNQRIAQKRSQNRGELEAILNGTNLNASNRTSILNKFNSNKNATLTSLRATIEELSKQRRVEKRLATRVEVERYLKKVGLTNADTKTVLNKFNADNSISLKNASDEANAILIQRVTEKMAQNRENLVQHMNGLNITNANRATILKNFDSEAASLNNLKNRATQINTAIKTKAAQRRELSNYINSLGVNGKELLNKFNNGRSNVNSIKKEADEIRKEMNARIVNAKRDELNQYMTNTFIPTQNRKAFLNRITVNTNMNSIKSNVKNMDNGIRTKKEQEARNRDDFSVFLNGLELTNKEKSDLLKNYNGGKTNVRNRALSINAAVKAKAAQRQELSNYINALGVNGKALLNKFNSGRSTLDKLKKDADKARALLNAKAVNAKKDDLRAYMKETRLPNTNKQSFLNRVELNTNMNTIKREIRELNAVLKGRNDEFARKKSELSVYLNGLNNLTSNQRTSLLKKVTNANTNIQSLKNEGNALNRGAKNKRAAQAAAEEEKKRKEAEAKKLQDEKKLDKHLLGLKHLTSKEMEGYMSNFKNGEALIDDLIAASKAKNADNEKDKDALRNYVRKATIPQTKKDVYLKQLNAPHMNATPIKGLVNANVATQKAELANAEAKLKKLSNVTADERAKFKNRLKTESVSNVLKEAEKLNTNRKAVRAAKDKITKNTAESLRTLTDLTRENRKMFMNRLATNGQQKVVSNAVALNNERKKIKRNADSAQKIEAEKKRLAEEAQKKRNVEEARMKRLKNQEKKNVASKLQGLTSLERQNRKKFMNRLATNGAQKVVSNATILNKERKKEEMERKMIEDKKKAEEAEKKAEEARMKQLKNQEKKNVASKLQGLTSLERQNRKKFMNRLATNGAQKVVSNATILNGERKKEEMERKMIEDKKKAEEAEKKAEEARMKRLKNQEKKNVASKLRGLTSLERQNRKKFMNRLATNGAQKVVSNATALNKERKMIEDKKKAEEAKKKAEEAEKKAEEARMKQLKNQEKKNVASKLQGLTSLERQNRKKFMNRLATNGAQKVVSNATALNKERKMIEDKKKAEEAKKKAEEAEKKAEEARMKQLKNQEKKNVASKLQGLTSLERQNRKKFMNRLATNGAQKVVSNATILNKERKMIEDKKKAEEAKKKAEEAKKKMQNMQTKRLATKLQGLTSLQRENRKKFMNRLATNGAQKVLANAQALNGERKKTREGIEWKLKKIGVKGSNLQGLMKRWNNSQNKTIWNDARAMVSKKREPLLKRIERNVPRQTNFAQGRMKWAAAIKDAKDDTEVAKIEKLLDDKLKLKARAEREVANLPSKQQTQYLQNIMAYKNDVADRTQKLNQLAKTKRETKDKATKEVAQKLQSLSKLERENRKKFMNRVAGGENAKKVVANADKLQRNRLAAERVKQQKAEQDKKALEERKRREEEEKKRKDQERSKQAKLKANTAKMFQSMNGLERKNRKEFMQRLERGNDPAKVIANARARDQMKKKPQNFTFNKRPANQIKTMTAAQRFGTPTKNRSTTGKSLKQKEADNMRKRREAQQKQRAKSKKRR